MTTQARWKRHRTDTPGLYYRVSEDGSRRYSFSWGHGKEQKWRSAPAGATYAEAVAFRDAALKNRPAKIKSRVVQGFRVSGDIKACIANTQALISSLDRVPFAPGMKARPRDHINALYALQDTLREADAEVNRIYVAPFRVA